MSLSLALSLDSSHHHLPHQAFALFLPLPLPHYLSAHFPRVMSSLALPLDLSLQSRLLSLSSRQSTRICTRTSSLPAPYHPSLSLTPSPAPSPALSPPPSLTFSLCSPSSSTCLSPSPCFQVMQKAGNVQAMLKQGPFGSGSPEAAEQLKEGERKLKRYSSFIEVQPPRMPSRGAAKRCARVVWCWCEREAITDSFHIPRAHSFHIPPAYSSFKSPRARVARSSM